MHVSPGTRLGPYEILAIIGAGGMGEVYKARDTRLHRDVAVKVLPASFAGDPERLHRFQLEAQSASALNHPNILVVHDLGTYQSSPYLVSELLEGESLRERLRAGKPSISRAIDYARQIATGLAAAHARGITHRDIKPENLFLSEDGRVKILDFGLAKVTNLKPGEDDRTETFATVPGTIVGTAAYMSPEQIRGKAVDQRSDIFSFGCVLYEMLTGEMAFQGDTAADRMGAILRDEPDLAGKTTPLLASVVQHCLEKNPEERFQSAADIVFALNSVTQTTSAAQPRIAPPAGKKWIPLALGGLLIGVCAWLLFHASRPVPELRVQRLTFRHGHIAAARFDPDGHSVVYDAQWEDAPREPFSVRLDSSESRPLGFNNYGLLGISSTSELALAANPRTGSSSFALIGTLARAPISGGAARSLAEGISFADWNPKGNEIAVVQETKQGNQLEYPAGKVLYQSAGDIANPRFSPRGDQIAFLDHPVQNDDGGSVAIIDLAGKKRTLTGRFASLGGLAWSARGDEIWFTAARTGAKSDLWAVTLGGKQRLVYRPTSTLVLHDIARDGRVLITTESMASKVMFRGPRDSRERDLSWLDFSTVSDITADGKSILIVESGEGAGAEYAVYFRGTDGSPAVKLGPGGRGTFSPDGQQVVSRLQDGSGFMVYPIGAGQSRKMQFNGFRLTQVGFMPDSKALWIYGSEGAHGPRYYLTSIDGQRPRPITPEGVHWAAASVTPDGKWLVGYSGANAYLYPVTGDNPVMLDGLLTSESLTGWGERGDSYFVRQRGPVPTKVYRVDRRSSRHELFVELAPGDRAGISGGLTIRITPDGSAYAYSYMQRLSELVLMEGLK